MKQLVFIAVITFSFLTAGTSAQIRNTNNRPTTKTAQTVQNTPEALLRDLYRQHEKSGKHPEKEDDQIIQSKSRVLLDKYFDKNLADLIWNDLKTHTDEVGVIDFDLFYAAQDMDIKNLLVGQAKIAGDKAVVPVSFTNYKTKETVTYSLERQNSGWKISDIEYRNGETLLKYFEEDAESTRAFDNFAGTYQVGNTTCVVKRAEMEFEVQWAKGSGTEKFFFDGKNSGKYSFYSEDAGKRKNMFVFDDESSKTGKFVRADRKESIVKKIK